MTFKFSQRSLDKLKTCAPDLRRVLHRAIEITPIDFSVIEGHRSVDRQKDLYDKGMSKIDGINKLSKHNYKPSQAFDVVPYPIDWNDRERFCILAGVIMAAAAIEGVELRWGGDWDGDGYTSDHTFSDLPHFELQK